MQPFDWQVTSAALMDDRYREMARTKWASQAMHLPRLRTRLSLSARLRVFATGRIDPADVPFEAMHPARLH